MLLIDTHAARIAESSARTVARRNLGSYLNKCKPCVRESVCVCVNYRYHIGAQMDRGCTRTTGITAPVWPDRAV